MTASAARARGIRSYLLDGLVSSQDLQRMLGCYRFCSCQTDARDRGDRLAVDCRRRDQSTSRCAKKLGELTDSGHDMHGLVRRTGDGVMPNQ